MELREYQKECVEAIQQMETGEKKIVYIATGGGKTIIMSELARRTNGRILVIVGSTELREQTIDKMIQVCGDDISIGSVQGGLNEVDKNIIVATRQSLTHPKSHRMEDILVAGSFDYVLIDEAHQAVSQVKRVLEVVGTNCKIIGFTATPFNKLMTDIFDDFVFTKDIESLIDENYLCEPRCYRIPTNTDISGVRSVGGEFVQSDLERTVNNNDRNLVVVKAYMDKAINRKHCIVFATGIDHAMNLAECFNINGISAKSIDSTIDSDERKQTLEDFKNGKFKVLVNVSILTTGFDFKPIDTIIQARPTKSKILYTQCIGRGLRIAEGKEDCLILDIVDNSNKFNLLSCKSIFNMENGESFQEARQREQKEKDDMKKRIEEQKRIEEEQERIRMEEVQLFNNSLSNVLYNSNLDWFRTYVSGQEVIILSVRSDLDYIITYGEEKELNCYTYHKLDGFKYEFELLETNDNLLELMESVEEKAVKEGSSFTYKRSIWKREPATENQIKATKDKIRKVNPTKWDVHKFFVGRNLYFAFKNLAS
jgi:superfamily II DNA or RNA helicase